MVKVPQPDFGIQLALSCRNSHITSTLSQLNSNTPWSSMQIFPLQYFSLVILVGFFDGGFKLYLMKEEMNKLEETGDTSNFGGGHFVQDMNNPGPSVSSATPGVIPHVDISTTQEFSTSQSAVPSSSLPLVDCVPENLRRDIIQGKERTRL